MRSVCDASWWSGERIEQINSWNILTTAIHIISPLKYMVLVWANCSFGRNEKIIKLTFFIQKKKCLLHSYSLSIEAFNTNEKKKEKSVNTTKICRFVWWHDFRAYFVCVDIPIINLNEILDVLVCNRVGSSIVSANYEQCTMRSIIVPSKTTCANDNERNERKKKHHRQPSI